MHYQRDGAMSSGQGGSATHYYPNSDDTAPKDHQEFREPALPLGEVSVDRYDSREGHDDYSQAGSLLPPHDTRRAAAAAQGCRRPA